MWSRNNRRCFLTALKLQCDSNALEHVRRPSVSVPSRSSLCLLRTFQQIIQQSHVIQLVIRADCAADSASRNFPRMSPSRKMKYSYIFTYNGTNEKISQHKIGQHPILHMTTSCSSPK